MPDITRSQSTTISRDVVSPGVVLLVIPVLFLVFDGAIRVIEIAPVIGVSSVCFRRGQPY